MRSAKIRLNAKGREAFTASFFYLQGPLDFPVLPAYSVQKARKRKILISVNFFCILLCIPLCALWFGYCFSAEQKDQLWLIYYVGISDGTQETDGVTFKVEIGEPGKKGSSVAEDEWAESSWKFCKVEISKFRDKKIAIKFITDPGATTNCDWASWGEIRIIKGELPKNYNGEALPAGVSVLVDFMKIKPARTGYIKEDEDITPIDTKNTGSTFEATKRACGGVEKPVYFAHPGWQGDAAGCPTFGEFVIDLANLAIATSPPEEKSKKTKIDEGGGPIEGEEPNYEEKEGIISLRVKDFSYTGGVKFKITYEWMVSEVIEQNYNIFVHFTSPEFGEKDREDIAFQGDHGFSKPTSQWKENTPIKDGPYSLTVPEQNGPAIYYIAMGLFNENGRSTDIAGLSDGGGRFYLGKLIVSGEPGKITDIKFEKMKNQE